MTKEPLSDDAPATELFPQFQAELYRMVSEEVAGLTDEQLDWYSDRWEWSKWSIRRQVSHMGSFVPGWLFRRWGEQLFPQGTEHLGRLAETYPSPTKRWMDESQYWALPELLERIEALMQLAQRVLASETVRSMRRKQLS